MNEEIIIHQEELGKPVASSGPNPFQKPPRFRNWQHWKRALKWVGITLVLAVIAFIAYGFFNVSKVSINPFGFGKLDGESRGRVNIMMLGVGDPGHEAEGLSDTNILLSVDTRNSKIAVISIPRDTQVKIPRYGEGKINNAHARGGVKSSRAVFEDTLGVPVDYYVKANFSGLSQVVDAVGGVDVKNTTLLVDTSYPCDKNQYRSCGYRLKPGQHHLNGSEALKYVRCRKGTCGDDFGRAERQQEVMQQIRAKATSAGTLANPISLTKLVKAGGDNIETDLSINNMMRLQQLTKQVGKDSIYNIVFNTDYDGFMVQDTASSDLLPADGTFEEIQAFVQSIFKYGPVWTEHPKVIIANGTVTPGLAGSLRDTIEEDGYNIRIDGISNALTRDYTTTQIIDYTGGKSKHTAAYLKKRLKVQNTTPPPAGTKSMVDFEIIVGADYAAMLNEPTTPSGRSTTQ